MLGGKQATTSCKNVEALPLHCGPSENGEWLPSGQFPIPKAPFIESVVYM